MSDETISNEFDKKYHIIDLKTPRHTLMAGRYKRSFAYYTLRNRLPVILTNIVDNLAKYKEELVTQYGELSREEIKTVIGQISELKYQLETDKPLLKFIGDAEDYEMWNLFIQNLPSTCASFYKTCWLYAECYMYRKVYSFFEATETLRNHDYFAKQKDNALDISVDAMNAVIISKRRLEHNEESLKRLLKLNLWGNRCDLSISSGKEIKPCENNFNYLQALQKKILVDSTSNVWHCLMSADRSKPVLIDFVLDNAGYELFTDLILAEYLIDNKIADKVRFHIKALPWFISDTTERDFMHTFAFFRKHHSVLISETGRHWTQLLEEGKFELQPKEFFWTSPYEYYKMRDVSPNLYKKLTESRLIILKGDLNYRKLLGDYTWESTEVFIKCIRGFLPTNIVALRTVKADLICGLRAGLTDELFRTDTNWMTTGEYGVIQFAEHASCGCEQETKTK